MKLSQNKDIYSSIENSETDGTIKFDLKKSISEAKSIEKKIQKNHPSLHDKFQKEYIELEKQIYQSIDSENKITANELIQIKYEIGDINKLDINPPTNNLLNNSEINKLKDIDVNKLPSNKLESILNYLNKNYEDYNDENTFTKVITGRNDTINSLSDKYEVRIFQEKILNRIIGNNRGYNNNSLQGYNSSVGNYIMKISDFENEIGTRYNIQSLNAKGLGNYMKSLSSVNKLDYSFLVEKFGEDKTDKILGLKDKFLTDNPESNWIKGHFTKIRNSIKKYFSELIKGDYNIFNKKMENINKDKKEKYIKQIENNPKDRDALIERDLIYLGKQSFDINKNHNDLLIKSLELSIAEGNNKLISILKQIGWKKEKINIFLEKIKTKKFNNPKDLGLFIKDIQKENPKIGAEHIAKIISTSVFISKNTEISKILKSDKPDEQKQKIIKQITETASINTTLLSSKSFISTVMNTSNIDEFDNILKNIIKNDNNLKNKLANLKSNHTHGDILDQYIGKNIIDNEFDYPINKTITIEYKNGDSLTFRKIGKLYNIDTGKEGNEGIDITKAEFDSIKNNPENLKNLLIFKETLSDLNLNFIWNHRHNFIKILNNIDPTLNIKIDKDNYINETELKKILNSIITLSGNKKRNENNLSGIEAQLRDISKSGLDQHKTDLEGSPIEKIFIDNGIINKNSTTSYFKIDKIKELYK